MKKVILALCIIGLIFAVQPVEKVQAKTAPSCFWDHGKYICCTITFAGAVCAESTPPPKPN